MENKIPQYLYKIADYNFNQAKIKSAKLSFLDKTILNSSKAVKSIYLQAENASRDNFIQKINPNIKLISLIYMVIVISVVSNLVTQILITALYFIIVCYRQIKDFRCIQENIYSCICIRIPCCSAGSTQCHYPWQNHI